MIPSGVRIFVCTEPQDMRRSFDGLSLAAQRHLGEDPQSDALFVFVNERRNGLKVLWFDRNGYFLLYKRHSQARFQLLGGRANGRPKTTIDARTLAWILRGVENAPRTSLCS